MADTTTTLVLHLRGAGATVASTSNWRCFCLTSALFGAGTVWFAVLKNSIHWCIQVYQQFTWLLLFLITLVSPHIEKVWLLQRRSRCTTKKNSSCANRLSQLKLVRIDQNTLLHIGAPIMDESAALIEKFLFSWLLSAATDALKRSDTYHAIRLWQVYHKCFCFLLQDQTFLSSMPCL